MDRKEKPLLLVSFKPNNQRKSGYYPHGIHSIEEYGGWCGQIRCNADIRRVVEKGSFSAVAKERRIGQPAVSKQISALKMSSAQNLFTAPLVRFH